MENKSINVLTIFRARPAVFIINTWYSKKALAVQYSEFGICFTLSILLDVWKVCIYSEQKFALLAGSYFAFSDAVTDLHYGAKHFIEEHVH